MDPVDLVRGLLVLDGVFYFFLQLFVHDFPAGVSTLGCRIQELLDESKSLN